MTRTRLVIAAVVMAIGGTGGLAAALGTSSPASAGVAAFSCLAGPDGTDQSFTVPVNVSAITAVVSGAQGGIGGVLGGDPGGAGANGGTATATISVTPGEVLTVNVGCQG